MNSLESCTTFRWGSVKLKEFSQYDRFRVFVSAILVGGKLLCANHGMLTSLDFTLAKPAWRAIRTRFPGLIQSAVLFRDKIFLFCLDSPTTPTRIVVFDMVSESLYDKGVDDVVLPSAQYRFSWVQPLDGTDEIVLCTPKRTSLLTVLNGISMNVRYVNPKGEIPWAVRDIASVASGGNIFTFGGRNPNRTASNELHVLSVRGGFFTWSLLGENLPRPMARTAASIIKVGNRLFLCGGKAYSVDIYDIRADQWYLREPVPLRNYDYGEYKFSGLPPTRQESPCCTYIPKEGGILFVPNYGRMEWLKASTTFTSKLLTRGRKAFPKKPRLFRG